MGYTYVVVTPLVVVTATPLVVTLVVNVLPAESVVVTAITTGTVDWACAAVMPARRELMSASREAICIEYWEGMAELNHEGTLVARRAE